MAEPAPAAPVAAANGTATEEDSDSSSTSSSSSSGGDSPQLPPCSRRPPPPPCSRRPPPAAAAAPAPARAATKKPLSFPKMQQLTRAVCQGQMGRVRLLVEDDLARAAKEPGPFAVFVRLFATLAAARGHMALLEYLLGKLSPGEKVNSLTPAARKHAGNVNLEKTKMLGYVKPSGSCADQVEWLLVPVLGAVDFRQSAAALFLLAREGDPVAAPVPGQQARSSPLHLACRWGYNRVVKVLLEQGLPVVGHTDEAGRTPLCVACEHNHAHAVQALCRHLRAEGGPRRLLRALEDPGDTNNVCRWWMAYACVSFDSVDSLKVVLDEAPRGRRFFASVHRNKGARQTPVEYAASCAALRCMKWLIDERGTLAPPMRRKKRQGQGQEPKEPPPLLHLVCASGAEEKACLAALEYLVEEVGLDMEGKHEGVTAAEVALQHDQPALHEYLTRGERAAAVRGGAVGWSGRVVWMLESLID